MSPIEDEASYSSKKLLPSAYETSYEVSDESSSDGSPPASPDSSTKDLVGLEQKDATKGRPMKTLKDRSKVPCSSYVTVGVIIGLQYFSGMYANITGVVASLNDSVTTSSHTFYDTLVYLQGLCQSIASGQAQDDPWEYVYAFTFCFLVGCLGYVLLVAPFRAGMWTGTRARRHKVHRYFGLAFLVQYALAWIEYLTNYEGGYRNSYLVHTIALNGA
jgi:hypothetical protein